MTEVLQASQSHWGLLLRNEAVSPFSISMSNSATSLIIEQHFVTNHFLHQQLEKNYFGTFKVYPFLAIWNLFWCWQEEATEWVPTNGDRQYGIPCVVAAI